MNDWLGFLIAAPLACAVGWGLGSGIRWLLDVRAERRGESS